ncbi:hypothetical protein NE237_026421 [Protea cynaroides]|uniref:Uncharacterized protein n=1 Tax=Protea cynaroides TaxID=273540 RepID=A0A9Q0H4W4_9MAGN|nr:hypothetical protein NE237_026421 [Protea cynaroides]
MAPLSPSSPTNEARKLCALFDGKWKLQQQLSEVGSKLENPPTSKDALIMLLKVGDVETRQISECETWFNKRHYYEASILVPTFLTTVLLKCVRTPREVLRPSGRSTLWSLFNPDDERKADRNNNSNKEVSVWGEEVEIETRNLGFYGVGRPTFKSREEGETDDEIRVFEEVAVHIVNPVVFAEERAPEIEEEEEEEQEEPW